MSEAMLFMTHWTGCWKEPSHHECAVAMVEKAEEVIVDMLVDSIPQKVLERARSWMMWKNGPRWTRTDKEQD